MSNETPTETDAAQSDMSTTDDDDAVDRFEHHPRELEAPPRNKEEQILAHVFANLSIRSLAGAFIAGAVIGIIAGQWMVASISISTAGIPQPVFLVMLALMGGTGMVGSEVMASLTAAYVKFHYGLTVDHPL